MKCFGSAGVPERLRSQSRPARVKEGGTPARPRRPRLTSEEASRKSRGYWDSLSPVERRIRTLSGRIGVGRAAERELEQLLAQLEAQQGGDAAEGSQHE